jgi:hypothetical protein
MSALFSKYELLNILKKLSKKNHPTSKVYMGMGVDTRPI